MLMHVGVSQKMSDKERDAVLPLLATGFKVDRCQCSFCSKALSNILLQLVMCSVCSI